MKILWKSLRNKIPTHITINKRNYEILWCESFADPDVLGEKRVDPCQIVLKTGESDKETVMTFGHELIHAIADEYQAGITESQVQKLERAIPDLIKILRNFI